VGLAKPDILYAWNWEQAGLSHNHTVRTRAYYISLVLVGIGLETLISLPMLRNSIESFMGFWHPTVALPFTSDIYLMLWYFLVPIGFCVFFSFTFTPKRIVSPLYIQIGTLGNTTATIVGTLVTHPCSALYDSFGQTILNYCVSFDYDFMYVLGVSWVLACIVLFVVGACQLLMVRWFVGLDLFDTLDRQSWVIRLDFKSVTNCIDRRYRNTYELDTMKREENLLLLYRRTEKGLCVVIAVGALEEQKQETMIATVAYRRRFHELERSDQASWDRDAMKGELERRLRLNGHRRRMTPKDATDRISDLACSFAIEPTRSRFRAGEAFLTRIPRYFQLLIAFTGTVLVTITSLYVIHFEGFECSIHYDVSRRSLKYTSAGYR
jgi:hypothetical protein